MFCLVCFWGDQSSLKHPVKYFNFSMFRFLFSIMWCFSTLYWKHWEYWELHHCGPWRVLSAPHHHCYRQCHIMPLWVSVMCLCGYSTQHSAPVCCIINWSAGVTKTGPGRVLPKLSSKCVHITHITHITHPPHLETNLVWYQITDITL